MQITGISPANSHEMRGFRPVTDNLAGVSPAISLLATQQRRLTVDFPSIPAESPQMIIPHARLSI